MKIYNEIILKWNDKTNKYDTVYEDSYNYDGPMLHTAEGDETKKNLQEVQDLLADINKDRDKDKD